MQRRMLLTLAIALFGQRPLRLHAQQPAAGFVGQWEGEVDGIGKARLVIVAVKPGGQVEGRMEFELHSFVSVFGDKADSGARTSLGIVSGSALTIESSLGGTYDLTMRGDQLAGTYSRGTTFNGKAAFKRP